MVISGGAGSPRISPNPANTYFRVIAEGEAINEITVFDASGKIIEHVVNNYANSDVRVAIDRIAAGIYVVEIKTPSQVFHQKLLKQ